MPKAAKTVKAGGCQGLAKELCNHRVTLRLAPWVSGLAEGPPYIGALARGPPLRQNVLTCDCLDDRLQAGVLGAEEVRTEVLIY